jgi:hypothetical protein
MARKQAAETLGRARAFEKATKGAPYSAETLLEGSQTRATATASTRRPPDALLSRQRGHAAGKDRANGNDVISYRRSVAGISYRSIP